MEGWEWGAKSHDVIVIVMKLVTAVMVVTVVIIGIFDSSYTSDSIYCCD